MLIICDESVLLAQAAFGTVAGAQLRLLSAGKITAESILGADALIVRSTVQIDATLLSKHTPSFIATATIGSDHVDLPLLQQRGVTFASAQGSSAATVTEFTWGLVALLAAAAKRPLTSYSLGVVGCGAIGERVARCGEELGLAVIRVDPLVANQGQGRSYEPASELSRCDLISLHVPLTVGGPHQTKDMVDYGWLNRLSPGTTLINTSRGPVLKGEDVIRACKEGIISTLALDVFPHEPAFDQVLVQSCTIATPHIAGRSLEGMTANTWAIAQSFCEHFDLPSISAPNDEVPVCPIHLCPEDGPADFVRSAWSLSALSESLKDVANEDAPGRSLVFKGLRRPPYRRDLTSLIGSSRGNKTCQRFLDALLAIPR